MKQTYCEVGGVGYPIFKSPKTDNSKKSAKGLLRVEKVDGEYVLFDDQTWEQEEQGELKAIMENGVLVRKETIEQIKNRLTGE